MLSCTSADCSKGCTSITFPQPACSAGTQMTCADTIDSYKQYDEFSYHYELVLFFKLLICTSWIVVYRYYLDSFTERAAAPASMTCGRLWLLLVQTFTMPPAPPLEPGTIPKESVIFRGSYVSMLTCFSCFDHNNLHLWLSLNKY